MKKNGIIIELVTKIIENEAFAIKGLTALLAMLNSCASTVSVVNIDNGFGAGYIASLIDRKEA